jgi:hypothetical protein
MSSSMNPAILLLTIARLARGNSGSTASRVKMMTLEAAGKRISEDRKSFADVDAYAQALGDMVCAYVGQLREARVTSQSAAALASSSRPRVTKRHA